ncbi:uncharacterized protein LOC112037297 [Quercus suber]|uniref:uncharacterized protein LOC111999905 n=1 Tax=Quercus suber TaxID=58331 RepID=UPI0032DED1EF
MFAVILLMGLLAIGRAYRAIRPPPPKICGSPGGPPITAPRIKLRDGRNLALQGAWCASTSGQEFIEELGLHILSFDKPSYGESGPHPKQTLKSLALDIEELVDQLELGSKFYVIGYSIGSHLVWGCLKYIPHRLAGVALLAPIINYWWAGGKVCLPNCLQRLTTNNYLRTSGQFELFITYHG